MAIRDRAIVPIEISVGFSEVLMVAVSCTEASGSRGRWRLNTFENPIPHA